MLLKVKSFDPTIILLENKRLPEREILNLNHTNPTTTTSTPLNSNSNNNSNLDTTSNSTLRLINHCSIIKSSNIDNFNHNH